MKPDAVPAQERYKATTKTLIVTRGREIAIGFFGWAICHNLYFLMGMPPNLPASSVSPTIFVALPFAIGLLALILLRKVWSGVGVVTAILAATMLWLYMGLPFWTGLFPFPFGLGVPVP